MKSKMILWGLTFVLLAAGTLAFGAESSRTERNLALHAAVFCSNGDDPEFAVDGNRSGSFWTAYCGPDNWLEVDLGTMRKITVLKVFFYWGDARIYCFFLQASTDGKNWKEVADARKNQIVSSKEGFTFELQPTQARYIRLYVISNTVNAASHVRELEIFGK